jgi:hypothetical protein
VALWRAAVGKPRNALKKAGVIELEQKQFFLLCG